MWSQKTTWAVHSVVGPLLVAEIQAPVSLVSKSSSPIQSSFFKEFASCLDSLKSMHTPVDMIFCFQNANNISVHYYVHTKYINSDLRTISQDVFCSKRRETSCEITVLFEANRVPEHFASSHVFSCRFRHVSRSFRLSAERLSIRRDWISSTPSEVSPQYRKGRDSKIASSNMT